MRTLIVLWAAAISIAAVAACSSGGGNSLSPIQSGAGSNSGNGASSSSAQRTTSVKILIPSASSSNSKLRRAKYVSSSTNGGTLTVYPALSTPPASPSVTVDLSSSSTACITNSDGSRSCTISVSAPIGNDNFVFNAYDTAPVNGSIPSTAKLLSTSTVAYTVALSSTTPTPTLSLTLNGVVATLSISPSTLVIPLNGTSAFAVTVDALDSDGNFIVGPGNYVDAKGNAVTISLQVSGDSSNQLALSTASVTGPGTNVTATYNGGAVAENPTITASATGFTSVSLNTRITSTAQTIAVTAATATPTPVPTSSTTATPTPTPTATPVAVRIATNFKKFSIPSGDYIWFTSVVAASGISTSSNVTVNMINGTIAFTSNGTSYNVSVPNFTLVFSTTATDSTISYSSVSNSWSETVPSTVSGNLLMGAVEFPVPATLSNSINAVTWTASFTTSQSSGLSLTWAWRAGVYTTFNTDYTQLGVKPIDGSTVLYANSDKAGTPESYKTAVIKGGTGNGGSDYTGDSSKSPSLTVTPTFVAPL